MLLLCSIWGIQQVAMKSIVVDVTPIMQLAIRFAGAAIFFGVWVLVSEGRSAFTDGTLASGLLLGVLFSIEFLLVGAALIRTTAAHTIVFIYSAPIFTALGVQFLPEERLNRLQWTGIAVAFLGIVIAFLGHSGKSAAELLSGDLLALAAGAAWGLSNVALRRGRVGNAATAKTVFYQVGAAALLLLSYAAVTGQTAVTLSRATIFCLLFQTLVISIFSYLVWFWMLRHYLTSRLILLTLMTPVFGVLFGAALLNDPIDLRFALGSLLVLAGVLVVNIRLKAKNLQSVA